MDGVIKFFMWQYPAMNARRGFLSLTALVFCCHPPENREKPTEVTSVDRIGSGVRVSVIFFKFSLYECCYTARGRLPYGGFSVGVMSGECLQQGVSLKFYSR